MRGSVWRWPGARKCTRHQRAATDQKSRTSASTNTDRTQGEVHPPKWLGLQILASFIREGGNLKFKIDLVEIGKIELISLLHGSISLKAL